MQKLSGHKTHPTWVVKLKFQNVVKAMCLYSFQGKKGMDRGEILSG